MVLGDPAEYAPKLVINTLLDSPVWVLVRAIGAAGETRSIIKVDLPGPSSGSEYSTIVINGAGELDGVGEGYLFPRTPSQAELDDPLLVDLSELYFIGRLWGDLRGLGEASSLRIFEDSDGRRIIENPYGYLRPDLRGSTTTMHAPDILNENLISLGAPWEVFGSAYAVVKPTAGASEQRFMYASMTPRGGGRYHVYFPISGEYNYPGDAPTLPNGGTLHSLHAFVEPGGRDNSSLVAAGFLADGPANVSALPSISQDISPNPPSWQMYRGALQSYEMSHGWALGRPWSYGKTTSEWWDLYEADGTTEWDHKTHTDTITTTASAFGTTGEIINHPKLAPNYTSGGYDGIDLISEVGIVTSTSHPANVKVWLDVSGPEDPLLNSSSGGDWGVQAVIDRLEAYGAEKGRLYATLSVTIDDVEKEVSTAELDVWLEWLKLAKVENIWWY